MSPSNTSASTLINLKGNGGTIVIRTKLFMYISKQKFPYVFYLDGNMYCDI